MARTKFRSRARARSAPRRAGLTRTSTTSVSSRSGDSWAKYILPAAAVGVVAYLLWPKTAKADPNKGGGGGGGVDLDKNKGGGGGGGGGGITPPPHQFPAGATLARVAVSDGLNVRAKPAPGAAKITALSPGAVFQMTDPLTVVGWVDFIPEEGLSVEETTGKNRWAAVVTASGQRGFLRAVGPAGEMNIQVTVQGAPGTGMLSPHFAPYHPHAQQFGWRNW